MKGNIHTNRYPHHLNTADFLAFSRSLNSNIEILLKFVLIHT